MKLRIWIVVVVIGALPISACSQSAKSQEGKPQDAIGWLNWMAKSARETNFSGTYFHQYGKYGNRTETSKIVHLVDETGEHEKLEMLDGPPREIIRTNDQITCYSPDTKLVKVDRKRARKFFPGLLSNVAAIMENYSAKLGGTERVAGFDCQVIVLEPRDKFRFGHEFCAESKSGLLLRARMLSDRADALEQFAFTQVSIGGPINRDLVKPTYAENKRVDWQTDTTGLRAPSNGSSWYVKSLPAGFKKIVEIKRDMSGRASPVIQQIYSDGLASVSVFIETNQPGEKPAAGIIEQGIYSLYVTPVEEQFNAKVLGEVPQVSLKQIGNSLATRH